MNEQTTVPPEFGADLSYLQPEDLGRMMASLVALGGEVFLLKAEVQRLRGALAACGVLKEADVDAAGASEAFQAWLETEHKAFARVLLDPLGGAAAAAHGKASQDPRR